MDNIEYTAAVEAVLSRVGKLEWDKGNAPGGSIDRIAVLEVGGRKRRLAFAFKPSGEPKVIAEYAGRLIGRSGSDTYSVLVAPFVSDRGRELCERSRIGCVDLSGNAYLEFDGVYISERGHANKYRSSRKQKKLLSPKGRRVIMSMLEDPGREWTMQELAERSRVSLAQVHKVLGKLEAESYIEKRRGAIRLSDPSGLLDEIAKGYNYNEQTIVGYYSYLSDYDEIFSKLKGLPDADYAITLGAAAQLVHPTVRSTDVYLYTRDPEAIRGALELEPVEFGGNVHLITPKDDDVLRRTQTIDGVKVVSNFQLYLDLYSYPRRGREQAEAIREKVLGV